MTQSVPHKPLRRLLDSVSALLQTRLELVGIEFAEEKERLFGTFFVAFIAIVCANMALISLTALVAVFFWDTYRWQALTGLTAFYAVIGIGCACKVRSILRNAPHIFKATLNELEKDRELFHSKS